MKTFVYMMLVASCAAEGERNLQAKCGTKKMADQGKSPDDTPTYYADQAYQFVGNDRQGAYDRVLSLPWEMRKDQFCKEVNNEAVDCCTESKNLTCGTRPMVEQGNSPTGPTYYGDQAYQMNGKDRQGAYDRVLSMPVAMRKDQFCREVNNEAVVCCTESKKDFERDMTKEEMEDAMRRGDDDRRGGEEEMEYPEGIFPCDNYQCPGGVPATGAEPAVGPMQCSSVWPQMPPMPSIEETMMNEMGTSFDPSMITDEMRYNFDMKMNDMMKNMQMPELPALCVPGHMCNGTADGKPQTHNFKGMDFLVDCDKGGKGSPDEKDLKDRRGRRGDDSDSDDEDLGNNFIDIGDDGVAMAMNQGGMGVEFEMGRDGTFGSAEMGPMKMEMEMERDDMNVNLDDGNGGRIQMEMGDDGVRIVMMNAKALLASATTAAAVTMTLF